MGGHFASMNATSAHTGGGLRIHAVDLLRGFALMFLALDYVRDFISADRLIDPLNLDEASLGLFLTRWITHFCAPAFVLLTGTSARLWEAKGRSKKQLSLFLLTRGLFLIALEIFVVGFIWDFQLNPLPMFLQLIWAMGLSMVVLSGLIFLPLSMIVGLAVAVIAGHNLLNGVAAPGGYWGHILWGVLRGDTVVCAQECVKHGNNVYLAFIAYPLIPWFAVMALGYGLGHLYEWSEGRRRQLLVRAALFSLALFAILRALNGYGDPDPWQARDGALETVLSFVNVEKFPPSFLFLAMTLGVGLLLLAWFEKMTGAWTRMVKVFGQAALFFYVVALFFAHVLAIVIGVGQGYPATEFLQGWWRYPPDFGVGILWVYVGWAVVVVLLYPICEWYADFRLRKPSGFFTYF